MKTKRKKSKPVRKKPVPEAKHYSCTDCGGNAYIGMSNWKGPGGQLIGKDERLCISCTRKRGIVWRS